MRTLLTILVFACLAAPAHASLVFDHRAEIWISTDDGSDARRLADGFEPHLAPGGATVVYRSLSARRVYAVPTAGGPRRLLRVLSRSEKGLPDYVPLSVDFSSGGRHVLFGSIDGGHSYLADLETGAVRRLRVPAESSRLSPDGTRVAIGGRRPCDLDVLDVASGRRRPLTRSGCATSIEWGPSGIAVVDVGVNAAGTEWRSRVRIVDPDARTSRFLLAARRLLRLAEPGPSGTWRFEAAEDRSHSAAAWVVRPDGRRLARTLPGDFDEPVRFGADDRSAIVQRQSGAIVRVDLATGARSRVGSTLVTFDAG